MSIIIQHKRFKIRGYISFGMYMYHHLPADWQMVGISRRRNNG